jgi:hypothetical protein
MELAVAAMAMMGGGGAVAGGLAGAAGMMQGAMTAASVFSSLVGGSIDYSEAQLQARAAKMQGEREALAIREETLKKIGDSRVAFGASGVTLDSALPVEGTLQSQSSREMSLARSSGRLNASRARIRGAARLVGAAGDAVGTAGTYATSVANRG